MQGVIGSIPIPPKDGMKRPDRNVGPFFMFHSNDKKKTLKSGGQSRRLQGSFQFDIASIFFVNAQTFELLTVRAEEADKKLVKFKSQRLNRHDKALEADHEEVSKQKHNP